MQESWKDMKVSETVDRIKLKVSESYTHDRAFIFIFFFAILIRCYEITLPYMKPWESGFQDVIARNHLIYGFLNTHFVSVLSVFQGQNIYHLPHPPLFQILLAISFKIFGIHEWSARFVPILFSLGGVFLIYLIVQKVWDKKTALLSAIFATFMPMSAYFGRIVNFEAVALFFVLLVLYGYVNWIDNGKNKYFLIMIIGTILGGLIDWPFYLILPCLLGYSIVTKKKVKSIFILLCIGILVSASYLLYCRFLTHNFYLFSNAIVARQGGFNFYFNPQFYYLLFNRIMLSPRGCTFIVGFLSLLWILDVFKNSTIKDNLHKNLFVLILFLFSFSYIFIFPQMSWVHDFTLFYLIPFFAISASLALKKVPKKVVILILAIFLIISFNSIMVTHSIRDNTWTIGEFINSNSKTEDITFIQTVNAIPYYNINGTNQYFYKNPYRSKEEFVLKEIPKFVVYYKMQKPDISLNVIKFSEFLESKDYIKIFENSIKVRQLHHPPLVEISKSNPVTQHPIKANFSNKIEFLGYNIDKTKFEIGEIAHIIYYWKCLERIEENYTVFVHFTDKDGKIVFQQDHQFCHGEYPTSEWKKGVVIKEEYYFPVPIKVKEGAYDIKIGVYIPHKERLDVITAENGYLDGWLLVIGKISVDMPWEFRYKTHAWLVSTLCICLFFLGIFRVMRLF